MSAVGCHHAPAAIGRSPQASLGARRKAAAASLLMFRTSSDYRRRAATYNVPPDALVHGKTIQRDQWGIKVGGEDEEVTLWFDITGVDESKVKDGVKVNLPRGSEVLTIKKKKITDADEPIDVRLLLTQGYNREEIKVELEKGKDDTAGKVFLNVIIGQKKASQPRDIVIEDYS